MFRVFSDIHTHTHTLRTCKCSSFVSSLHLQVNNLHASETIVSLSLTLPSIAIRLFILNECVCLIGTDGTKWPTTKADSKRHQFINCKIKHLAISNIHPLCLSTRTHERIQYSICLPHNATTHKHTHRAYVVPHTHYFPLCVPHSQSTIE